MFAKNIGSLCIAPLLTSVFSAISTINELDKYKTTKQAGALYESRGVATSRFAIPICQSVTCTHAQS